MNHIPGNAALTVTSRLMRSCFSSQADEPTEGITSLHETPMMLAEGGAEGEDEEEMEGEGEGGAEAG
ncbi:hypothetical protein HSBAA_33800 [Vreelandella sulfidaeris]|uniref:Uncharacterized protein n=1 Tax=Vreelandella sulfidaeris TaxID=115553 RepID=A0A455UGK9_9GAMM|nr:hypothetical protein HSBAA_33800 [Halomonas sulfidaeris]